MEERGKEEKNEWKGRFLKASIHNIQKQEFIKRVISRLATAEIRICELEDVSE